MSPRPPARRGRLAMDCPPAIRRGLRAAVPRPLRRPAWLLLALLPLAADAGELVYYPTHPAFGGNALNGSNLLNEANAQNTYKDPDAPRPPAPRSALQQFNDKLQNSVLNRIANSVTQSLYDSNGNLQPGTIETADFTIAITDPGDGTLLITTTDKTSGASTSFEILNPASTTP